MSPKRPPLDPRLLNPYVDTAWAGYRDRDAILEILSTLFPKDKAHVLEFASANGMHLLYFAPHFGHLQFHPSDMSNEVLPHIERLTKASGVGNVRKPRRLDFAQPHTWPGGDEKFHAVFCINISQVVPVSIADGMMRCVSKILADDGFLFIYGPFTINGYHTTPSNEEFDRAPCSTDMSAWGLKDLADLNWAAEGHGMRLDRWINIPADNFALVYRRA